MIEIHFDSLNGIILRYDEIHMFRIVVYVVYARNMYCKCAMLTDLNIAAKCWNTDDIFARSESSVIGQTIMRLRLTLIALYGRKRCGWHMNAFCVLSLRIKHSQKWVLFIRLGHFYDGFAFPRSAEIDRYREVHAPMQLTDVSRHSVYISFYFEAEVKTVTWFCMGTHT